jgi:hypothetical protein
MKKILSSLALGMLSFGAFAQTQSGITYTDEFIIVDMFQACYKRGMFAKCDLNDRGIGLVMTGAGSSDYYAYSSPNYGIYTQSTLVSNIPIMKVEYQCGYNNQCGSLKEGSIVGSAGVLTSSMEAPGLNTLSFRADYGTFPSKVYLSTGVPTFLKENFTAVGNILRSSYTGVLRNVTGFKNEIAKSHRGHLDRFNKALQDGIALIDAKDAKGLKLYSVLDWRVQENARLIVVFGSVLNELLSDYDDVERLKISINSMRVLVDQLRLSYGWNKGLAGTVSKASSSLIEVVRLELQEIASIKMAVGSDDLKVYMDMLKITRTLQAKVDASKSGDMKAQREIFEMVDLWNSKVWQDEMGKLMNAGPDFKNLVIPKLSMLIFAIESISDLSDQEFLIPDRALLK